MRIKLFSDYSSGDLEFKVNRWLEKNYEHISHINQIQYSSAKSNGSVTYSVLITYEEEEEKVK